jgi:hypothetical protein
MSGVVIVTDLLVSSPALIVAVPAGQIMGGGLPQGTPTPSLLATSVGTVDDHSLRGPARLITERVQVTIRAGTYRQQKLIERLVRQACDGRSGAIAGYAVTDLVSAGLGPDFRDDADEWLGSLDFRVSFRP